MLQPPIERAVKQAAKYIASEFRDEVEAQGHVASGAGKRSIKPGATKTGDDFVDTVIEMLAYKQDVNDGVPPSRVPPVKVHFGKIFAWLKKKKLATGNVKEDVRFSLNIARKHKRVGIPTPESRVYSRTGKRTGFIEDALARAKPEALGQLENKIEQAIKRLIK